MKQFFSILTLSLFSLAINAQVSDVVSLTPGYAVQSFYSLESGEVASVDATDWDIAFSTNAFGSSILVNDNIGMALYLVPAGVSYAEVDSAGMSTWEQLRNSDSDWNKGAFVSPADETNGFDYGWGIYDPTTHVVTGDRVFLMRMADESFRKVEVLDLTFGVYNFHSALLDGSDEQTGTVNSAAYETKNFVYYSFASDEAIDREPASDTWDITFTRYTEELPGIGNYLVTGALTNIGLNSAEIRNTPTADAYASDATFSEDISELGSDWKQFDMSIFQYIIEDDLSYFVTDQQGNTWKIIFTGFGGSMTGDIMFDKEIVAVGLDEEETIAFETYPNPSEGNVTLTFPIEEQGIAMQLIDLSGRIVAEQQLIAGATHQLDFNAQPAGMYILNIQAEGRNAQQIIVLR